MYQWVRVRRFRCISHLFSGLIKMIKRFVYLLLFGLVGAVAALYERIQRSHVHRLHPYHPYHPYHQIHICMLIVGIVPLFFCLFRCFSVSVKLSNKTMIMTIDNPTPTNTKRLQLFTESVVYLKLWFLLLYICTDTSLQSQHKQIHTQPCMLVSLR